MSSSCYLSKWSSRLHPWKMATIKSENARWLLCNLKGYLVWCRKEKEKRRKKNFCDTENPTRPFNVSCLWLVLPDLHGASKSKGQSLTGIIHHHHWPYLPVVGEGGKGGEWSTCTCRHSVNKASKSIGWHSPLWQMVQILHGTWQKMRIACTGHDSWHVLESCCEWPLPWQVAATTIFDSSSFTSSWSILQSINSLAL